MNRSLRMLVALAPMVAFAPVAAQNAPVVAVLVFENGAFGPGARDYDGIGKGIMDIVITDMASSPKVRVVDRERVQKILDEQNLTKSGAIDQQTAIRVGKMFGACYSVYGTFIRNDKTGENVLTIHTTSNETGQIQNGQKVMNKGDDVLKLIADASAKFINEVDVKACPGTAGTTRSGDAGSATQQSTTRPDAAVPVSKDASTTPSTAKIEEYRKPLTPEEKKRLESVKLDARTMLIYSRALDAKDRKENAKALALFQQVNAKFPDFDPAAKNIQALKSGN